MRTPSARVCVVGVSVLPTVHSTDRCGHHRRLDQNHPDIDAAVESAAAALRAFGLGDGRANFAGLRLDHRRQVTVIYRVPDPDFDRRVDELAGPFARVVLQGAAHARVDLEAARDRVWDLPGSEDITGLSVPAMGPR